MSSIDANGLQIDTLIEIRTSLENLWKETYGSDLDLSSATSDGQLINNLAQQFRDLLELLVDVNNNFDPTSAVGTFLSNRVAINGIQRKGGTFTQQIIDLTIDRYLSLPGLDDQAENINGVGYTVSDNNGNQFILLSSTILLAGVHSLTFRAKDLGAVQTLPNTITNPVTIVLGVTSINNPTSALVEGQNQETDAQLRLRQQLSTALSSFGYGNGLQGALQNISGVTDAIVFDNDTSGVVDTIPGHSIWCIIEGGSNEDIANTIYSKLNYGPGMKGSEVYTLSLPNGFYKEYKFDRPIGVNVYLRFDIKPLRANQNFNTNVIKQYIVDNFISSINSPVDTGTLTELALNAINSNSSYGVPLSVQVSRDGLVWSEYLATLTLQEKYLLSVANISIGILS